MRRIRPAVATVAALLLLAGCTSAVAGTGSIAGPAPARSAPPPRGSSLPPAPAPAAARFADCSRILPISKLHLPPGRRAHLHFDCAFMAVPLDYAKPGGPTVQLAMLRVHDDAAAGSRTPLLVNPGGPGGSGVALALGLAGKAPDRLLAHYDVIGLDPRGVSSSTPLRCLSDHRKDVLNAASPDMLTRPGFARAAALAASFANACERKYGARLPYFTTVAAARDMDQVRRALGRRRLDYLGFSYGTELGSVYAHLFPSHVGRMVLDGAVDPLTSPVARDAEQLRGFEQALGQFAKWCRGHQPGRQLGNVPTTVQRIVRAAGRRPIPAAGKGRTATAQLVITGTFGALYSRKDWPKLAKGLLRARHGNSAGLLSLADSTLERIGGRYTNLADASEAYTCNDSPPTPGDARLRAVARDWARRFPVFGRWFATELLTCQKWQPVRTIPPRPTAAGTPHTVLVVGNLHDPATPYRGARDLTRVMGHAELLTWNGEGHTSYLNGSPCINRHVDNYLVAGTLPPPHTVCPR
jgi:pimeloyl-ACP methyl ester carboxylesterase